MKFKKIMRVTWPDYVTSEIVRELCIHKIKAEVLKPAGNSGKGKIQVQYYGVNDYNTMEEIIRTNLKKHPLKLKQTMYSIEGRTCYLNEEGEVNLYDENYPPRMD